VLADITRILADQQISIDAMIQREPAEGEEQTDIIMLTHLTREKNMPTPPSPASRRCRSSAGTISSLRPSLAGLIIVEHHHLGHAAHLLDFTRREEQPVAEDEAGDRRAVGLAMLAHGSRADQHEAIIAGIQPGEHCLGIARVDQRHLAAARFEQAGKPLEILNDVGWRWPARVFVG
jgi:hypothetical protein